MAAQLQLMAGQLDHLANCILSAARNEKSGLEVIFLVHLQSFASKIFFH